MTSCPSAQVWGDLAPACAPIKHGPMTSIGLSPSYSWRPSTPNDGFHGDGVDPRSRASPSIRARCDLIGFSAGTTRSLAVPLAADHHDDIDERRMMTGQTCRTVATYRGASPVRGCPRGFGGEGERPVNENAQSRTRTSLHAVAESVLAGHQYRSDGTIRLHVVPGGFATGPLSGIPSLLVVRADEVEVHDDAGSRSISLAGRTLGEIAAEAGVSCGPPSEVYRSSTPSNDDFRVELDRAEVYRLSEALALGDTALRLLAGTSTDQLTDPVLWPEHFDISSSAPGGTVGVSPGDEYVDGPYAYVVPDVMRTGDFWNQPFGAARPLPPGSDPEAVVEFFTEGLRRAVTDPQRAD